MPRLINRHPTYRKHKTSGQAVVTLGGRDYYLGPYGTAASRTEYDRLIAEWISRGKRAPGSDDGATVVEIVAAFLDHAEKHYRRKDGSITPEVANFRDAVRPLLKLYARTPAAEFGPVALKTIRGEMVRLDWCRTNINRQINRVRHVFKWAVSEQLVPAAVFHGLQAVAGLEAGRSDARESDPVTPVADARVDAVLPFLSRQVAAMVKLQRLTGMRPGEVCAMRAADIDTTGTVWQYRPAQHKTAHRGAIGPQARDIITEFLKLDPHAYLFSPADAEAERRAAAHARRKTPTSCGNVPGANRQRRPRKQPGARYSVEAYCGAIRKACERAFGMPDDIKPAARRKGVTPDTPAEAKRKAASRTAWHDANGWHPNQLRHNAATRFRAEYGIDVAQTILGHKLGSNITEIYAERNIEKATQVMAMVG